MELCEVGDEQQGGEGVEVEGAAVTEGEDDHGGAIEGGEGGEGGVEHSRERINEVGRWGRRGEGRGEGRFRLDNAKVGLCGRRWAAAETLHGEEPKVGARALQGLGRGEKGRGVQTEMGVACGRNGVARRRKGAQKSPTAGGGSGLEGAWARMGLQ